MTAHRAKPTITPERVAWFAAYHHKPGNFAWGVFHTSLEDGNYNNGAASTMKRPGTGCHDKTTGKWIPERWDVTRSEWPEDVREAAEWFDNLTSSQRRRLARKTALDPAIAGEALYGAAWPSSLRPSTP